MLCKLLKKLNLRSSKRSTSQKMGQADNSFFGLKVTTWPKSVLMIFCISGLFSVLLVKGVIHEYLLKHYHFKEPCFLTLALFIADVASTFPTPILIFTRKVSLKAPITVYIGISLIIALSKMLMNYASLRITFTTGVLFKSCGLIPVLVGNIIFLKKMPKLIEILSVILYVFGLTIISLGDKQVNNEFDLFGILAISLAMTLKAIAANIEELVLNHYGATQDELIAMLYSFSTILMFFMAIATGQLFSGAKRIIDNPSILVLVLVVVVLGAIAVQFVFLTIKSFGSLFNDMLLSMRKVLTVCLSFFVFKDKTFTSLHGIALFFILIGMIVNVHEKTKKKSKKGTKQENHENSEHDPFINNNEKNNSKSTGNADEKQFVPPLL
ncbi:Slc35b3 protein [Tritrichomonas foetus]|uniref:Slc35b3 protein n=1 Tax=Tritrichomonas foetus TaxID=1144522 RepID=A0A1J4K4H1_9EUKA|nr:Slc35b3 protein [Tritrichomonas foetus]|eukprot:OHT04582.1 Slc35b3 protein [Tritrichomonas foetus]